MFLCLRPKGESCRGIDFLYSKTQVRNAGDYLRRLVAEGVDLRQADPDKVIWAWDVLDNFRAAHEYALTKATMGLRSRVDTMYRNLLGPDHGRQLKVSQRLKRHVSIVGKLSRQPTMKLHTMQDVAGCRAVVDTIEQVRLVQRRWETKKGRVCWVDEYITTPKTTGYRGVHVIVSYDDRLVEVQLRTLVQHEWATTIERIGGRIRQDLKAGVGPRPVLEFFQAVSEAMAIEEAGEVVPSELVGRIQALRRTAEPMMERQP